MAARLIDETEIIEVKTLCTVVFGPPGVGKTSMCQTATKPFTLDFDAGIHRSFNRKGVAQFDTFHDVDDPAVKKKIADAQTVVVDTTGRALDLLSSEIIAGTAKYGTASGGLTLQGYGVLKARFSMWAKQLRLAGKDLILICHEKEEKDGDDRIMRPDIQGGSYTEVHKLADMIGYLYRDRQGKRFLDFNPTDRHLGKNAAGWEAMAVPDLAESKAFFGDLLADAKTRIGKTAEASASIAADVDKFSKILTDDLTIEALNGRLPELKDIKVKAAKVQAWEMIEKFASDRNWTFDKASKAFVGEAA